MIIVKADRINLEIPERKFITIIGPSGSGKTTLAKLLAGLIPSDSGKITVDGLDISDTKNNRELRQKLAYIGRNADYNNILATTLEELAAFGPENFGIPREEISKRIDQALKITGLEKFRSVSIYSLPNREKQISALASFLTLNPKYLILDEPTAFFSEDDENYFWKIINNVYKYYNLSIIYFSNGTFIPPCDNLYHLKDKIITEISIDDPIFAPAPAIAPEIKNLTFILKTDKSILEKINLMDKKLLRQKIGLVFQYPENRFFTETTEQEINFGLKNLNIPEKEKLERIEWICKLLSLDYDNLKNHDLLYLPLAYKRKVALVSALVTFPKILVLDDTLAGLDPKERHIFLSAISEFQKKTDSSITLFTSRIIAGVEFKPTSHAFDTLFELCQGGV